MKDSSSFTNISIKVRSGDIFFSELNLFMMKALVHDHILSASSQCIPDHIDTLRCNKKSTSVMLGSIKSKNFSYLQIFGQSHLKFGAEISGDVDTAFTLCFHRRTGFQDHECTLMNQFSARENQSMTKNVVSIFEW